MAAMAVTPASNKVCGLSGDVVDTSKASVQLEISISAGHVLLWLGVRLLPKHSDTLPQCSHKVCCAW